MTIKPASLFTQAARLAKVQRLAEEYSVSEDTAKAYLEAEEWVYANAASSLRVDLRVGFATRNA